MKMDCENCEVREFCRKDFSHWSPLPEIEKERIIRIIRDCFLYKIKTGKGKQIYTFKISCN